ncbi:TetR/AcrR family transcriptional regulator [Kineococcus sp. LSe6-4]|uniref:TetR/AcrR family transcriptional regulator n=1 Tax=Kineococcus halophytocola TaxID=3234027 RepID=A0ABV4GXD2_9ACTN
MLARLGDDGALPGRADASRNRELLLCTARDLLREVGPEELSMDALAEAAGLGKGTVFRRFGSRAGLFAALLDEDERAFQAACLAGPPPLGPGADPLERLVAFGRERLRFADHRAALLREARARPSTAGSPGDFSRLHLRVLLEAAGARGDTEVLAYQLQAALEAPLRHHVEAGPAGPAAAHAPPLERLTAGWADLVRRVVPGR